jgi:hypothetical protein
MHARSRAHTHTHKHAHTYTRSPKNIRGMFSHVLSLADQLTCILRSAGPGCALDLDNLLQRESLDVIGRIGFNTDFRALKLFARTMEGGAKGDSASGDSWEGLKGREVLQVGRVLCSRVAQVPGRGAVALCNASSMQPLVHPAGLPMPSSQ